MKIKKGCLFLLTSIFLFLFITTAWAASPLGTWTTIDDKTHKPRSVIQITESKGTLYGKILKVFPQPGDTGICTQCPGSFKNKKIKGLTIMWGLKKTGSNNWSGGQILDPKTGRIYNCKLSVGSKGKTLKVRGYIGFALIGRTQTWARLHASGKELTGNKTSSGKKILNKPTSRNTTQSITKPSSETKSQPKNKARSENKTQPTNTVPSVNLNPPTNQ